MATGNNAVANQQPIDYDLHGVVGIRLINPTEKDARAVVGQLGPAHKPLDRDPDIIIRFQEKIDTPNLTNVGLHAGYTKDAFYILRSSKAPAKVRIPFDEIGNDQFEILCQSGMRSVPLLIAIINLTFLKKNYLPLHASAFKYNGLNVVLVGWAKGGKTEALISFANNGAHYIADEWTIFSEDGQQMFGIPEPIRLWDWHFQYIPGIEKEIKSQKKFLFKGIHALDSVNNGFRNIGLGKFFPIKMLGEALPAFKRQLNIRILPEKLFDNRFCDGAAPEKLFMIMSHQESDIRVESCDPMEIARQMLSSNEFEQMPFLEFYYAFKFAFPDRENEFIENIQERMAAILMRVFDGVEAYRVRHPYPFSFHELFKKMQPFCEKKQEVMS